MLWRGRWSIEISKTRAGQSIVLDSGYRLHIGSQQPGKKMGYEAQARPSERTVDFEGRSVPRTRTETPSRVQREDWATQVG